MTTPQNDAMNLEPLPRQSRTRKALIEAGKRLISSGQMEGATIDDIVREADVAKGSFYNHFQDREELAQHVLSIVKTDLQAMISEATQNVDDTPAHFARGMLTSFRYGMANSVGARVLMNVTLGVTDPKSPNNAALVQRLQVGIDEGSLKVENIDTALVLLFGLSDLGLSRLLDLHDERQQAREVMRGICIALLRGLGVDARRIERVVDDAMKAILDAPSKPIGASAKPSRKLAIAKGLAMPPAAASVALEGRTTRARR